MSLVVPQSCPHCGGAIADLPRVGARTLAAARAVAAGHRWSDEIAAHLTLSLLATGNLLRRAEHAGLVRVAETRGLPTGGRRFRYVATDLLAIFEVAPPPRAAQRRA